MSMISRLLAVAEGYREDAFDCAARTSLIGSELDPFDDDVVVYEGEFDDGEETRVDTVRMPKTSDPIWRLGHDVVEMMIEYSATV